MNDRSFSDPGLHCAYRGVGEADLASFHPDVGGRVEGLKEEKGGGCCRRRCNRSVFIFLNTMVMIKSRNQRDYLLQETCLFMF